MVARLLSQPCTVSSNKPGYAIVIYKHRSALGSAFSLCAAAPRAQRAIFLLRRHFHRRAVCKLFANRACLQTPRGPACKSNKQTNTSNKHLFVNCLQTVNKHRTLVKSALARLALVCKPRERCAHPLLSARVTRSLSSWRGLRASSSYSVRALSDSFEYMRAAWRSSRAQKLWRSPAGNCWSTPWWWLVPR